MDRCCMEHRGRRALLLPALVALLVLSGCVGKSTGNPQSGNVQNVTLNPTNTLSLEFGKSTNFTATARDSAGRTVFTTIHFNSDNNAALTIANNGQACAGRWDSFSNPVRCNPGVEGIANVTAEAEGVSSAPVKVYVHEHIQSMQVTPVAGQTCLQTTCSCFSQGTAWQFQATAFGANQTDITNSVGPITWSSSNPSVLTVDAVADQPNNQVQVTARTPGITELFPSVSGTTGDPLTYTACLVKSIKLQVQGGSGNSTILNAGGAKTVEATAVDTLDFTLSKPPLTWSTSNPEIATVTTSGVVTGRQDTGAADISASCTPPSCNVGVLPGLPVYSTGGTLPNGQPAFGVIVAQVTQAKPPTATAWVATQDCKTNFNCTSVMFPVTTGTTPVGNAVGVPFTPNSMVFTPTGTRIYMGSDKGLMFLDVGATTPAVSTVSTATTPCNAAVCGTVLTISPDSSRVVVSDTTTIPNQVYIFDATHATTPPTNLLIDGAVAAAFSPDQMKLFILTSSGKMYVSSTVDALTFTNIAPGATGLSFAADGSLAYVSGEPGSAISGFATCNAHDLGASPALPSNPLRVVPLPGIREDHIQIPNQDDGDVTEHSVITQDLIAIVPPNVQLLTAQFSRDEIDLPTQLTCNPPYFYVNKPIYNGFSAGASFNLGQGDFSPLLMRVTGDGSQVIIVAQNIPAVLTFSVNGGTTTAIPLANNASPLAGSATQDGSQVFVTSCDGDPQNPNTCGSIHIVNTLNGGDIQQAIFTNVNTNDSMCNNLPGPPCLPNLIAVRPQ
jgi:hypothetical protein